MAKTLQELQATMRQGQTPVGLQSPIFQQILQQRVNGFYTPPERQIETPQVQGPSMPAPMVTPSAGHFAGDGHNHAGGQGLDPKFNEAVMRMMKDAPGSIKINSGFRSVNKQAALWQNALKKYGSPAAARKWVAPPGKSNHGRGIAIDLGYGSPAIRQWTHANASKYGLYFPLAHEPWHVEPLGSRR